MLSFDDWSTVYKLEKEVGESMQITMEFETVRKGRGVLYVIAVNLYKQNRTRRGKIAVFVTLALQKFRLKIIAASSVGRMFIMCCSCIDRMGSFH